MLFVHRRWPTKLSRREPESQSTDVGQRPFLHPPAEAGLELWNAGTDRKGDVLDDSMSRTLPCCSGSLQGCVPDHLGSWTP